MHNAESSSAEQGDNACWQKRQRIYNNTVFNQVMKHQSAGTKATYSQGQNNAVFDQVKNHQSIGIKATDCKVWTSRLTKGQRNEVHAQFHEMHNAEASNSTEEWSDNARWQKRQRFLVELMAMNDKVQIL